MKLLYDLFTVYAGRSAVHGGGIYGIALLREILARMESGALPGIQLQLAVPPSGLRTPDIAARAGRLGVPVQEVTSEAEILEVGRRGGFEVVYTALPYTFPRDGRPAAGRRAAPRFRGTIHGLRELEIVPDRDYRSYLRNPLRKAALWGEAVLPDYFRSRARKAYRSIFRQLDNKLLVVSDHTKRLVLSEFPEIPAEDVSVVASFHEDLPGEAPAAAVVSARPYFLMVSCDRPVKNAYRVLEAVDKGLIRGIEAFDLVCVGFRSDQKEHVGRRYPRASGTVKHLGYVDRPTLNRLYRDAFCFVFPSVSEGFGYPPLEAMRYGTPVAASHATAIPETCGGAALLFDPYSIGDIAAALTKMIDDGDLRGRLVRLGPKRYADYSATLPSRVDAVLRYLS